MSQSRPTFRDLRATFESRSKPTTATACSSTAEDLANMSSQQNGRRVPSLAKSIDSVLDTSPAQPAVRPPLARLRPSWIGPPPPERPQTPGIQAMKQPVTVEYSSPGLQPPVYICTNLSEPQWDLVEMHCEPEDHGPSVFSRTFSAEEGEYQYKFRLGAGDWWVCDETKPMVDDGQGNQNNLLKVISRPILSVSSSTTEKSNPSAPTSDHQNVAAAATVVPLTNSSLPAGAPTTPDGDRLKSATPTMRDASSSMTNIATGITLQKNDSPPVPPSHDERVEESHAYMLLSHEQMNEAIDDSPTSNISDDDSSSHDDDVNWEDEEGTGTPLLRHETFSAPLDKPESRDSSPTIDEDPSPGKTLVKFPTHHAGIIEMIIRTQQRLPEDDASDEAVSDSPTSEALSDDSQTAYTLSRISEDEEEMLVKIREAEEDEFEREKADGDELDPLATDDVSKGLEPEDADFEPRTDAPEEEVEEYVIVEVEDRRKSVVDKVIDHVGGRSNAIAMTVGLLVIAAGICTMQFL